MHLTDTERRWQHWGQGRAGRQTLFRDTLVNGAHLSRPGLSPPVLLPRATQAALGPPRAEAGPGECRGPSEGDQLNTSAQERERAQKFVQCPLLGPHGGIWGKVRDSLCEDPLPLCQLRSLTSESTPMVNTRSGAEAS